MISLKKSKRSPRLKHERHPFSFSTEKNSSCLLIVVRGHIVTEASSRIPSVFSIYSFEGIVIPEAQTYAVNATREKHIDNIKHKQGLKTFSWIVHLFAGKNSVPVIELLGISSQFAVVPYFQIPPDKNTDTVKVYPLYRKNRAYLFFCISVSTVDPVILCGIPSAANISLLPVSDVRNSVEEQGHPAPADLPSIITAVVRNFRISARLILQNLICVIATASLSCRSISVQASDRHNTLAIRLPFTALGDHDVFWLRFGGRNQQIPYIFNATDNRFIPTVNKCRPPSSNQRSILSFRTISALLPTNLTPYVMINP